MTLKTYNCSLWLYCGASQQNPNTTVSAIDHRLLRWWSIKNKICNYYSALRKLDHVLFFWISIANSPVYLSVDSCLSIWYLITFHSSHISATLRCSLPVEYQGYTQVVTILEQVWHAILKDQITPWCIVWTQMLIGHSVNAEFYYPVYQLFSVASISWLIPRSALDIEMHHNF